MKKLVLASMLAGALSAPALAQTTVIETTGSAPPDEVVTYIKRERVPSVRVEGDVAVGFAVPATVRLHTIPSHRQYSYTVINDRRVLVEPKTRKVIRIVE